jgi:hypothetical protein
VPAEHYLSPSDNFNTTPVNAMRGTYLFPEAFKADGFDTQTYKSVPVPKQLRDVTSAAIHLSGPSIRSTKNQSYDLRGDLPPVMTGEIPVGAAIGTYGALAGRKPYRGFGY